MGLVYDSSLMADDDCYELLLDGQPTGVVELPVEWIRDDAVYFNMNRFASLRPYTPPSAVLEIFRREFDAAYAEGGLFQLTMHPHIIGHRSRMMMLEELIRHIRAHSRHLVRDARRRRALRQAEGLNDRERQRRQGMKRTILALLAAIAAASAPVVAGEAWAQGKYVHANNSGYDNLDPHAIFDVGRAASRINFYDGLYRWVDNPPKMIPWLAESHTVSRRRQDLDLQAEAEARSSTTAASSPPTT